MWDNGEQTWKLSAMEKLWETLVVLPSFRPPSLFTHVPDPFTPGHPHDNPYYKGKGIGDRQPNLHPPAQISSHQFVRNGRPGLRRFDVLNCFCLLGLTARSNILGRFFLTEEDISVGTSKRLAASLSQCCGQQEKSKKLSAVILHRKEKAL